MALKSKEENTTTELIEIETAPIRDADILNTEYNFDEKIEVASKVATSLKNVIDGQGFAVKLGKDEYVTVEGWETLGTMLGCTPYVEDVEELDMKHPRFGYKATVSIRQGDNILSRASAVAVRDNKQSERPAVYSMAQTRALGKAYRMALGWIIKMAGYSGTPYEEMGEVEKKMKKNNRNGKVIDAEVKK